jgi:methionyl-tRNA synthetase
LHEYLKDFPARQDELRYVLTSIAPETKDSDFSWKDYQQRVNSELADILGNFVNRVMVLTHKYFGGIVPVSEFTPDENVEQVTAAYYENLPDLMNSFNFRQAQFEAMQLARTGNKYLADAQPWKMNLETEKEKIASIIAYSLDITARISIAVSPFLPNTSQKIRRMLNLPDSFSWNDLLLQHLPEGHKIGIPEILFRKIEDSEIETQLEKLKASREAQKPINTHKPVKDSISYDDFMKMDLRVGTILEASKVEKADKLLKLIIDTGIDRRTVVSGIAEHFTPDEIVGKQVTVLLNLEPRKIRGIESQGMILMAEDETGKLKFVQPSDSVNPGAEVR